ncbi:MAG: type II secretion system F family protein [Motilibacteraceae bacterium]
MSALVALLVLAGGLLLRPARPDRRLRRLLVHQAPGGGSAVGGAMGRRPGGDVALAPATQRAAVRWAAAFAGGGGVALLLGGAVGAAAGLLVAVTALRALPRLAAGEDPRRLVEELPLVADLLAAGVSAGLEVGAAAAAVAAAVDGPWGAALSRAVALHRLGAEAAQSWGGLGLREPVRAPAVDPGGAHDRDPSGDLERVIVEAAGVLPASAGAAAGQDPRAPEVAAFARSVARAVAGGAPLADSLARLAGEVRQAQRASAQEAAHRAGVRMVGPLVACALPAFVLVGVVPAVAGLAGGALGQLP